MLLNTGNVTQASTYSTVLTIWGSGRPSRSCSAACTIGHQVRAKARAQRTNRQGLAGLNTRLWGDWQFLACEAEQVSLT